MSGSGSLFSVSNSRAIAANAGIQFRTSSTVEVLNGAMMNVTSNKIGCDVFAMAINESCIRASSEAGGISVATDSSIKVHGQNSALIVNHNEAGSGAGLFVSSITSYIWITEGATLEASRNVAVGEGDVYCGAALTLVNKAKAFIDSVDALDPNKIMVTFKDNIATLGSGGAISVATSSALFLTSRHLFQGNKALKGNGGAIAFRSREIYGDNGESNCVSILVSISKMDTTQLDNLWLYTAPASAISHQPGSRTLTGVSGTQQTRVCVPCGKYQFNFRSERPGISFSRAATLSIKIDRRDTLKNLVMLRGDEGQSTGGYTPTSTGKRQGLTTTSQSWPGHFKQIIQITCNNQGIILQNGDYIGNEAKNGGALGTSDDRKNSMFYIENTKFIKNIADSSGGALQLSGFNSGAELTNVDFVENEAGDNGGAIVVDKNAALQWKGGMAQSNKVVGMNSDGGFLYTNFGRSILMNTCVVEQNTCEGSGGALYVGSTIIALSNMNFNSNRAMGNSEGHWGSGGAVAAKQGSHVHVLSSTFTNNTANEYGGQAYIVSSSFIIHNKGTLFEWPKMDPILPAIVSLTAYTGTTFAHGSASSGGSISVVASANIDSETIIEQSIDPDSWCTHTKYKYFSPLTSLTSPTHGTGAYSPFADEDSRQESIRTADMYNSAMKTMSASTEDKGTGPAIPYQYACFFNGIYLGLRSIIEYSTATGDDIEGRGGGAIQAVMSNIEMVGSGIQLSSSAVHGGAVTLETNSQLHMYGETDIDVVSATCTDPDGGTICNSHNANELSCTFQARTIADGGTCVFVAAMEATCTDPDAGENCKNYNVDSATCVAKTDDSGTNCVFTSASAATCTDPDDIGTTCNAHNTDANTCTQVERTDAAGDACLFNNVVMISSFLNNNTAGVPMFIENENENFPSIQGSGGGLFCNSCNKLKFNKANIMYNTAFNEGGGLFISDPKEDLISKDTVYSGNVALLGDGGAVWAMSKQARTETAPSILQWNSEHDVFDSNIAINGNGGAMSLVNIKLRMKTSRLIKNQSPMGGGGAIQWEPLALGRMVTTRDINKDPAMTTATHWTLSDFQSTESGQEEVENTEQAPLLDESTISEMSDNTAAYGPNFCTRAIQIFPVVVDPFDGLPKNTTAYSSTTSTNAPADQTINFQVSPTPTVEIRDYYNHTVIGSNSKYVLKVSAIPGANPATLLGTTEAGVISTPVCFGANEDKDEDYEGGVSVLDHHTMASLNDPSKAVERSTGIIEYSKIGVQAVPGTNAEIGYTYDLDLRITNFNGKSRTILSHAAGYAAYLNPWANCKVPPHTVEISLCGTNQYSVADQNICLNCPANAYSKPSSINITQCTCNNNMYLDVDRGTCIECPTYSSSPRGSDSIDDCICPSATHVRLNTVSTRQQQVKSSIRTITTTTVSCILCSAGYTKSALTGQCVACPAGTYKKIEGSSACLECGANTWSASIGATAESECIACAADRTTNYLTGRNDSTACLCSKDAYYNNNGTCSPCPSGGDCSKHHHLNIEEVSGQTGYWHTNSTSTIFANCEDAYNNGMSNKKQLAQERCCPLNITTNKSICYDLIKMEIVDMELNMEMEMNRQCKTGYIGPLCKICAPEHVWLNSECTYCQGGSNMVTAILVLLVCCVPVYVVSFIVMVCTPSLDAFEENEDKAKSIVGQVKIMIAFVQILASLPSIMDGVPWPNNFLSLSNPLSAININLLGLGTFATCNISLLFQSQFLLHMCVPILYVLSIFLAYMTVVIACARKKDKKEEMKKTKQAVSSKMIIVGVLFLYPSLVTKIFTLFRCKEYNGVLSAGGAQRALLEIDFTTVCWSEEHMSYVVVGIAAGLVYVLGIPVLIFLVLWSNRASLWDLNHPNHHNTYFRLGGLYQQYEPKFWWYEVMIVLHKMLMTGALCVIGQGSAVQPLVAILFQFTYLLVVLKVAPYDSSGDDWSSILTSLTIVLTLLIAFALATDGNGEKNASSFDGEFFGVLMIGMFVCTMVVQIGIMVLLDCSVLEKIQKKCGGRKKTKEKESGNGNEFESSSNGGPKTKVVPLNDCMDDFEMKSTQ